ncbi:Protein phosphatase inhibitor family protein [Candida albicans]|uniref:Type 1 phosphatases regulator n=2 Tax=Candida albicans TaxID=5476 RepID=A0A8H6F565_CANAX|nr:Protein phosphatase inhibitor family protein [Candida albicans]KGQ97579.1 type 1 phosphatase regulator YPI2 [Candida albicans P37005]KGR16711.1 type 1 phosphatase regulator YPI2 [Candida albicans P78048]KGR23056.1 type 1 phosphatase regulator YPI2 [Candida albicans P37037]KGT71872.1 type 1 phosphatase regulator YPI2 [Candida albicans 12C]KGU16989.1 type 1 phosphatase regulator YPI2 [Candida albicans 19F]KHC60721.1 type 1 phosphatase regulator YPI2 [Candida albicans P37039]RLP62688.1 type 
MSNQPSRTIVQENNVLRLRPGSEPTPSSSNQQPPQQEQQQETTSTKKKKKKKAPKVRWTEGTVDNEHMNKKKTKICCIFHPQRSFDEEVEDDKHNHSCSSSDESSDSSDNEGDKGEDESRPSNGIPKPNAYEYQPHYENRSKLPEQG